MNKAERAGYLVSLHTLIDAQTKAVVSTASKTLGDEYEREWKALKEQIQQEQEDETGNEQQQSRRPEAGTDKPRRLSGSGLSDRDTRGGGTGS